MKINYNDRGKRIKDVEKGECFTFCGSLYIKTDESLCDMPKTGDRRYRCVNLNSGYVEAIAEWQVVKVVDAEVVVK